MVDRKECFYFIFDCFFFFFFILKGRDQTYFERIEEELEAVAVERPRCHFKCQVVDFRDILLPSVVPNTTHHPTAAAGGRAS